MNLPESATHKMEGEACCGPIPSRFLGRTSRQVTQFALGGEGVLRTHGRSAEAVAVINRALDQGVTYCDTAPAYAGSLDYYGAALAERRSQIFLASKTHDRTREGSLRLLDQSLERARTDHLDLWQLHDLRSLADLQMIFGRGGALKRSSRHASKGGLSTWVLPAIMIRPSFWKQCEGSISIRS